MIVTAGLDIVFAFLAAFFLTRLRLPPLGPLLLHPQRLLLSLGGCELPGLPFWLHPIRNIVGFAWASSALTGVRAFDETDCGVEAISLIFQ